MKIYVGRWDLLPANLEGYNGLSQMKRMDVVCELSREIDEYAKTHTKEDILMGVYNEVEFEETFNQDIEERFNTQTYWIKIF